MARNYLMYIDGKWARSSTGETIEVRNPYDGSLFATVQKGSRDEAKAAIDAAYRAKDSWTEPLAVERVNYLYRLHALAFGNTVVLKPASATPINELLVAELLDATGLLQVSST